MDTTTLHTQIDIHDIFPSLFAALRLVSDPREIGCLLGLINDIVLFFIQSYVHGTDEVADYLTTPRSFAVEYLQNFALMSATHADRLVVMEELTNLVRITYSHYVRRTTITRPAWTAVNTQPTFQMQIMAIEYIVIKLIHVAAIEHMRHRSHNSDDIYAMEIGWDDGKF
jgi:hypothetical protein